MAARFEMDESGFPLVVVTIPDKPVSDAEVTTFIAGQRAFLGRRRKHLMLTDARRGHVMPPLQRKLFGDWLQEANEGTRQFTAGLAIISDNALVRGALTAVLWIREPACPTKMVASFDEAIDFLVACGTRAGMEDLDRVRAYRAAGSAHAPR